MRKSFGKYLLIVVLVLRQKVLSGEAAPTSADAAS